MATKWEGGGQVLPIQKEGTEKGFAMLKGGGHNQKFCGSFNTGG